MKKLFLSLAVLVCLCAPVFADGQMENPSITGQMENPSVVSEGQMENPSIFEVLFSMF